MAKCAACEALLGQLTTAPPHADLELLGHVVTVEGNIAKYQCQVCRTVWQRFIPSTTQDGQEDIWKIV